jgi:hypothetical protein
MPYEVAWLGSMTDRGVVARRVSPMASVRQGPPAPLTVHGDADPDAPCARAVVLPAIRESPVAKKLMER